MPLVRSILVLGLVVSSVVSLVDAVATGMSQPEVSEYAYMSPSGLDEPIGEANDAVEVAIDAGDVGVAEVAEVNAAAKGSKEKKPQKPSKSSKKKVPKGKNGKKPPSKGSKNNNKVTSSSAWRTTGITFFGQTPRDDNGLGLTGIDLFTHGRADIRYKGEPVYPAAVFQGDAAKYLYAVLEVTSADFRRSPKKVLLHVVDACNSSQRICRTNVRRFGDFLVDIHDTATGRTGVDDGLIKGSFRVVGEIAPNDLPEKVWKGGWKLCSCRGSCKKNSEQAWKPTGERC